MRRFKIMSRFTIICLVFSLVFGTTALSEEQTTYTENKTVTTSVASKYLKIVWTNLNNNLIRVDTVLAKGKVGQVDSLEGIYNSSNDSDGEPLAAINGSFFAAYTDLQPYGTSIINGEVKHISNTGSVLSFDKDNNGRVDHLYLRIVGSTQNQWEWPYNWSAWNINHFYENEEAIMVFNSDYNGVKPIHEFTSIEVEHNIVTNITTGGFNIPEEGFLVITSDDTTIEKFQIGKAADYQIEYYENDLATKNGTDNLIDFSDIRTSVGAGPMLVKNGEIVVNPVAEGFTETKITEASLLRTLVGVTKDNQLGMTIVSDVTMAELAEVALELGMVEAMSLDGGGSAGIYVSDGYLFKPGRDISNALVVRKLYEEPIGINLNGKPLFFDTEPYLNQEYDRTLVPLRGITENLGASVSWDSSTSSILIQRADIELRLQVGSNTVYVNNKAKIMDVPVTIKDDRSYVPVRFVTEFLGGSVDWDQETKTVILEIENSTELIVEAETALENGDYSKAINLYKEVLKEEAGNIQALTALSTIYYTNLKEYENAIVYLTQAVELLPNDYSLQNTLAWACYSTGDINSALDVFSGMVILDENNPSGYYGIALCYSHYQMQEEILAKSNFELAVNMGLSGYGLDYAKEYISEH